MTRSAGNTALPNSGLYSNHVAILHRFADIITFTVDVGAFDLEKLHVTYARVTEGRGQNLLHS